MDYGFELDPGESVVRVVHRHFMDLIPTLALAGLLALVAAALAYMLGYTPQTMPFPPILMTALIGVMLTISVVMVLVGVHVYRNNFLVFTNIHLVQVEQLALFQKRVSQLNFEKVEDVTGRRTGILQSLFNYGNVEIQSASEREKFIFKHAPDPHDVADEAMRLHEISLRRDDHPSTPPSSKYK